MSEDPQYVEPPFLSKTPLILLGKSSFRRKSSDIKAGIQQEDWHILRLFNRNKELS